LRLFTCFCPPHQTLVTHYSLLTIYDAFRAKMNWRGCQIYKLPTALSKKELLSNIFTLSTSHTINLMPVTYALIFNHLKSGEK
jgi:hypothetical protein